MTAIIIKNIYRTNLSQPGGLVRVLDVAPSDYNPDGTACYIEHVEDHPYGYPQGTKGWYEDRDLVTVCQYCGEDLAEGENCQNCGIVDEPEDDMEGYSFLCDECGISTWTKVSERSNKALCNGCYAAEYYSPLYESPERDYFVDSDDDYDYEPDKPDWVGLLPAEFLVSWCSKLVITSNGDVWNVRLLVYGDGHRECIREQLADTCEDIGVLPF